MKIYDISMEIHPDMPVYKNIESKKPVVTSLRKMPRDDINETMISMNLHTGTHIDGPNHMLENSRGTDSLDLKYLIGKCRVLDLTKVDEKITAKDLSSKEIYPGDRILLKTSNSLNENIPTNFVYLSKNGAEYLADKNILLVGIDSLGIERDQPGHPTHKTLLSVPSIIIEGLRLGHVPEGEYEMMALPIKISGSDGAPARVILTD